MCELFTHTHTATRGKSTDRLLSTHARVQHNDPTYSNVDLFLFDCQRAAAQLFMIIIIIYELLLLWRIPVSSCRYDYNYGSSGDFFCSQSVTRYRHSFALPSSIADVINLSYCYCKCCCFHIVGRKSAAFSSLTEHL